MAAATVVQTAAAQGKAGVNVNGAGKKPVEVKPKTEPETFTNSSKFFVGKQVEISAPPGHVLTLAQETTKADELGELTGTLLELTTSEGGEPLSAVIRHKSGRKYFISTLVSVVGCAVSYTERVETEGDDKDEE